jgi:putative ABC transport system permease protein
VIALFVILIACINYINLATSRSSLRAKEIGVRKVTGANRSSLVRQFLIESVITSSIAFVIALFLAFLLLPAINQLTQKQLILFSVENSGWLLGGLSAAIGVGLIAGIYPALYLSSFKPISVIKRMKLTERGAFNLRKALVVLQFSISVILITGTLIIIKQVNYVQEARLGINKDQVMIIQGTGQLGSRANSAAFKNELLEIPAVKNIAGADGVVGGLNWTNALRPKGSDKEVLVNFLSVGYDYFKVMEMDIKEGRSFSDKFPGDTLQAGLRGTTDRNSGAIILNETAVKDFPLSSPVIGQQLAWNDDEDTTYYVTVVGVVKDFHFTSLRNEIKPFAFVVEPPRENLLMVKISGSDMQNTIATIEKKWGKYSPDRPFQYSFLDETYSKLYQSERRFNKVFLYLTGLAILIACLGLFGLAAFTAEQRTVEIGIRKVVGASVSGIVTLLSKDFVKLVLISIVIALPIAWYTMNKWLQDFAYRVSIEWWVFVLAAMIAILIALVTVSFQAIKAALANPVGA